MDRLVESLIDKVDKELWMYACMLAVSETISEVLCTQSELSHMASTQHGFYSWLRVHRKAKKVIVMPPQSSSWSFLSWQKQPPFPIPASALSQCAGQPSGSWWGCSAKPSCLLRSLKCLKPRRTSRLLHSLQSASVCFLVLLAPSSLHGAFPGMLPRLTWLSLDVGCLPSLRC